MKKKTLKILTTLCLTLATSISLIGCGSKLPSNPIDLLTASQKKSEAVKSMNGKATMLFDMSLAGETLSMTMNMDMDLFIKDMKSKVISTMDMGEMGSETVEVYTAKEDDKFYTYTNSTSADSWSKSELELADFEATISEYGSASMLSSFTDIGDSFTLEQTDEISTLTGVLTGETMQEMIEMTGLLDQLGSVVDTSIYESLGDLPIVIVIDNKTLLPKNISMDMTVMMQGIMDASMKDLGSAELDGMTVEIGKCTMDFEYSNYDKVEAFEIPEEAKAA